MHDLIIIGAGPAGITAAVYAARKRMNLLVIAKDIGGQAALSGDIENYTGYQFITGPELALKFQEHIKRFDIKLNMPEEARDIKIEENSLKTITDKGEYQSRAVIIASGAKPRLLNIQGEEAYKNKGLTYCATCDGPLFKGKAVAIVGGGNSALDAALQLIKISPRVYIINISESLTADAVMAEKALAAPNVEVFNNAQVQNIYGDSFLRGIKVKEKDKELDLKVEGLFVEIGYIPNSGFIEQVKKNNSNEIIIDRANRTSIEGIFACGDVSDVGEKQIIIACGEGAKASLSVFQYLSSRK
ncbi:MAG: FAD-dependent oxidoreductase [Candidatus Omnitrophica bacterium]|nr:FAD-dependent oxidoreductase [Candidatus Omnitrophota bacterium]